MHSYIISLPISMLTCMSHAPQLYNTFYTFCSIVPFCIRVYAMVFIHLFSTWSAQVTLCSLPSYWWPWCPSESCSLSPSCHWPVTHNVWSLCRPTTQGPCSIACPHLSNSSLCQNTPLLVCRPASLARASQGAVRDPWHHVPEDEVWSCHCDAV